MIYAYANNHYADHAPATIEQFRNLWHAKGLPEFNRPRKARRKIAAVRVKGKTHDRANKDLDAAGLQFGTNPVVR